ncbi:MAG: GldG family protein, partial [Bdellovibrionaceae bacterium]|nr:GldG family protein [Pseudobdellovibrionaceae bacterium]
MISRHKMILAVSFFFLICLGGMYFALQSWMPFMWILLVFGSSGLIYVGFAERKLLGEFTKLKTTKHGLSLGSALVLTLCVLGFVNYFSVKFVRVFDYSMTRQYTLSEQSKKIIDGLDGELEIKYFYKDGLQNIDQIKKSFLNLAKVFETYSRKIKVSSVEMNSNPALTELFGATKGTGEGFVSYKGKMNRIETQFVGMTGIAYSEQDFTNAMIKTTRIKFKSVYFVEGHKERSIGDEKDELAIAGFKKALEKNSYTVKSLNLITAGSIPDQADLLIIGGAAEPYQKSEVALINNYLMAGRPILILFDSSKGYMAGPSDILDNVGWKLGAEFVFNILTTPNGPMVSTDQATVANTFSTESDMTRLFGTNRSVLFFRPHPLELKKAANQNSQPEVLVKTSQQTVGL